MGLSYVSHPIGFNTRCWLDIHQRQIKLRTHDYSFQICGCFFARVYLKERRGRKFFLKKIKKFIFPRNPDGSECVFLVFIFY